ncbi:MAG TPA: SDR family oxidoreductase [Acetobacteraceae bacterium]|nr:SDR family oxidoreductase [Acetobacteraceae bacterium]
MEISLAGRVALVTGGSRGLGFAAAAEFAASGADIAILARRPDVLAEAKEELARTAEGRVVAFPCDVSRAADIARAHEAVMAEFGRVDILLNNAGTARHGAFEEITDAIWQEDLDLKLFAAIRFTRLVWPGMKKRRWGRVINVLNTGAKAPAAGGAPTAVSRAAGMALTKILAGEGAAHNVLANAILIGLIVSEQWERRHANEGSNTSFAEFVARMGESVPLKRMGRAEEFASLACFLASDAASYITGTAINLDGGRSPVA